MSIVQCPNGHFFNNETFDQCPICSGTGNEVPDISIPTPTSPSAVAQSQSDDDAPTEMLQPQDDARTIAFFNTSEYYSDPVVGWLVCREGKERGHDFRLKTGINSIGKGENMRIKLQDEAIPENTTAVLLAFAERKRIFLASVPPESSLEVLLNDKPLSSTQTILSARDEIRIGQTVLRFMPFCDETFIW